MQGRRPSPLLLHKASSRAIKKSPPRKPVVIHMVSPKVIHVPPGEFMSLVQRLTGSAGSSSSLPPATVTAEDETSGNGELARCGSSPERVLEAIRAPSSQRAVPMVTETPELQGYYREPKRPSDQPAASWYDFFMDQSSSGAPVSSSGHVHASPGPYVDTSCRPVIRETLTRDRGET